MDPVAAKYIGAGIACIGMGGAGVGVGIIFGNYLAAALRNPSAAQGQFGNLIFGFAITEALGIFSLLIALLLLFALKDETRACIGVDEGRRHAHNEHRASCAGWTRLLSAFPVGNLRLTTRLAGDCLHVALRADGETGAATRQL